MVASIRLKFASSIVMPQEEEFFREALIGKKIPVLTLDNQWHQLVGKVEPDRQVAKLQEESRSPWS